MDRIGRIPVLLVGFAIGVVGGVLAAIGCAASGRLVLAGLVAVGVASGTALLARTAAGDMYPPERRARGIALVLFGAVFGALLGPLVFSPMLAGKDLDGDALAPLWLAGRLHGRRRSCWCCSCGPTPSESPSCCTRTPNRRRGRPRRCGRSSHARA